MFDRWSSPRVGMHYAVDVIDGKLIAALSFHET
jgi:membrane-associated phospholipid phosphatase